MHAARVPGYAPGGLLDEWDLDLLGEFGIRQEDFPELVWEKLVVDGKLTAIALDSHPDRKSTRLNSSHVAISYAVFCLKNKRSIQGEANEPSRDQVIAKVESI